MPALFLPRAVFSEQAHLHGLVFVRFLLSIRFRHFYGFGILQLLDGLPSVLLPPLSENRSMAPVSRFSDVLKAKKHQSLVLGFRFLFQASHDFNNLVGPDFLQLFDIRFFIWIVFHLEHIPFWSKGVARFPYRVSRIESWPANADS